MWVVFGAITFIRWGKCGQCNVYPLDTSSAHQNWEPYLREKHFEELYFLLANHDFGNRVVVLLRCSVWINQYELPSNVFVAIPAKRFNLKHIRVCNKCCQKCTISLRCRVEGLQRIPSKGMYVFGTEKLTFNTAVFTLLSAAVGETSSDDTVLEMDNRLFHKSKKQ